MTEQPAARVLDTRADAARTRADCVRRLAGGLRLGGGARLSSGAWLAGAAGHDGVRRPWLRTRRLLLPPAASAASAASVGADGSERRRSAWMATAALVPAVSGAEAGPEEGDGRGTATA